MPILSTNFNDIGNAGQTPSLFRIETNDSLSTVQTPGYLNILKDQNLPLTEDSVVLVSTGTGANKATTSMRMVFSNGDWNLEILEGYQASLDDLNLPTATVASNDKVLIQDVSDGDKLKTVTAQSIADLGGGGASVVLPTTANHIATYTNTTGTISEDAATAINNGNIQAGSSGTAGTLASFPSTAGEGSLIIQAANVSAGDFSSTITNSSALTQSKVYTLPNTQDFNDPPTICAVDSTGAPSAGNLAVWSGVNGGLADGGAVPVSILKQSNTATISSSSLMSLNGSGLSVVANPFPGFIGLLVSHVVINFTYGTTPYASTTGNFYIAYDAAGTIRCSELLPQSVFTATSNRIFIIYPDPALNDFARSIDASNLYFVSDHNMTTGDSGINLTVYYSWMNIF